MPPFTRSQTPLMIPGLDNALASSRVLFFMLLAFSARTPEWYPAIALVSKRFKRELDAMLQDPAVLAQVTLWDPSLRHSRRLLAQRRFLERFGPALGKVEAITMIAKPEMPIWCSGLVHSDHTFLLKYGTGFPLFPSLKHLTLLEVTEDKLTSYLNYFDGRLTHLTTDCVITTEGMRAVTRFPPKVTLTSPAFRQDTIMAVPDDGSLVRALMNTVGVMTRKGLEVLEIESYFPSGRPMRLHLTDCVGGCGCT